MDYGKKTMYLQHLKFLNQCHPYRRLEKVFNEHQEHDICPIELTN